MHKLQTLIESKGHKKEKKKKNTGVENKTDLGWCDPTDLNP
jgi:hypothetical protein